MFIDYDFAEVYCPDNDRDSVPPSLLATALLLQTRDKVSDADNLWRDVAKSSSGNEAGKLSGYGRVRGRDAVAPVRQTVGSI